MRYKVNQTVKIFCAILLFVLAGFSIVSADTVRDITIDRAIGGMKEGSRVLPPGTYGKETVPNVSGKTLSPGMDAKVIAPSPAAQGNTVDRGVAGGNFPGGVEQISGPNNTDTTETGGNAGATPAETTNPIVDVDANVDLNSGTVETDVGVNPSADQILDTDLSGAGAGTEGTTQIDVGSASDVVAPGETTAPETSEEASNPIIDIDASADLDSGTVDAGVGIDTSGDQLLDADAGTTGAGSAGTVETDIGSSVIDPPSDLSAEVDTTGETVGGTTDIGVEADVSGTAEGDDVVTDPADGTSLGL